MLAGAVGLTAPVVQGAEVIHLGNLKFAHYGAVSYLKEIGPECGVQIDERVFAKGLDILPAIQAGEIDVAASALEAAIAGRAAGIPIYAVAGFARGGARIIGRADLDYPFGVASLKGLRVGVARGGAQESLLLAELTRAGLSWSERGDKDVRIVPMAFDDLNRALMLQEIDAMSQSEPQSSQALNRGFGTEIVKPYDTPLGEPIRALIMTEALHDQRPELAHRLMLCFVRATATFIADPGLAERYIRERMFANRITAQDYVDAMDNAAFTYDLPVERVQRVTDLMALYGIGGMVKPPRARDWVKLELLATAKAELGVP